MKCCDTVPDCQQGKYCPERVARVPIELQQLPGRQAGRRTLRDILLLGIVIVAAILGAIGLIAKGIGA